MKKVFFILMILLAIGLSACKEDKKSEDDELQIKYKESDSVAENVDQNLSLNNNKFAFDILKKLVDEDKDNVFISPFSISTAFAMLYNGTTNETKQEMEKVLHFNESDIEYFNNEYKNLQTSLKNADEDVIISISNSNWLNEGFEPKNTYIETVKKYYFSEVYTRDFGKKDTVDEINLWIDNATNHLIPEMVDESIANSIMLIINAVYFKGNWIYQFDPKETKEMEFYGNDKNTYTVEMMSNQSDYLAYDDGEIEAVRLPYGRDKLAMYIIMADKKSQLSINDVLNKIDGEKLEEYIEKFENFSELIVRIPKFKIEYGKKSLVDSSSAWQETPLSIDGEECLSLPQTSFSFFG